MPAELPPEDRKMLTVLLGGKLIDGTGAEPIADSVVVVEGTRIRAAGPRSHTPVPKGAEIINASGKTIIPGLIDLHAHYNSYPIEGLPYALAAQLAFGVTTSRSVGGDTEEILEVLRSVAPGRLSGPRLFSAGPGFAHPDGHPIALETTLRPATPEEAREGVRRLAALKVDVLKMWVDDKYGALPKITPEIRAVIVAEGAKHGIPSVAHIFDEADVRELAELGMTDFLHTVRDHEPMSEDFIAFCKERGVGFVPTLSVIESNWLFAESPETLLDDAEARAAVVPASIPLVEDAGWREQRLADPLIARLNLELARAQRFVKQMHEAGVAIAVGSDTGTAMIPLGWGTHNEMRLLVEAGLSPLEVIRLATAAGAARLGRAGDDIGTLEAGKIADLVLLSADPAEDIANTRKIERVMQLGKWVDRESSN